MPRIGVLGAGSAFRDFLSILPETVEVAALADNDPERIGSLVEGHRVLRVEDVAARPLDLYVVTARQVDPIRAQLASLDIPQDRVCAYYPSYSDDLCETVNQDIAMLNRSLGLQLPPAGIATMYLDPEDRGAPRAAPGEDFVRRHAFRLCARLLEQRGVPGAVAELGVYRGEQAALLNRLFPDRALHLFDTFEGFAEEDVATELRQGFSQAERGDFRDTSVELVLARMENPERVVIHRGFFPRTAVGLEETFAFVSLDVDLFEPTLAGLEWFHPRLARGGCIFVHDYNNRRFSGVRRAVDRFLEATSASALPLPDFAGSIVVMR